MASIFPRTERYRLVRELGRGGMGVVFEVEDRERRERVALKTLQRFDAEGLYRLKQEFRALAELDDKHVVLLHELVADEENCYFTMELVDGVDMLEYVRVASSFRNAEVETAEKLGGVRDEAAYMTGDPRNVADGLIPRPPPAVFRPTSPQVIWPCFDANRLRACLAQLVPSLDHVHRAGLVHRDLKPSNIKVTTAGRVVLLDFGLVATLDRRRETTRRDALGTAKYMAPEQCRGAPPTAASDWYSVGAVLYEALAGRPAFSGHPTTIMLDKQSRLPAAPHTLFPEMPRDLDELCMGLLSRRPEDRPTGAQVLRLLGLSDDRKTVLSAPSVRAVSCNFAGRQGELGILHRAFSSLTPQRSAVVLVSGESGVGKSALVEEFLELALGDRPTTIVPKSRCHERETVPYQAVDGMVDDLSRFWRELPQAEAEALVPGAAASMRRVFPVLGRVPALAACPIARGVGDPQKIKTQAISGVRETLEKLAVWRPLVWVLDDMQWAGRRTLRLVSELLAAPDPPPMLVLLVTRSEGREKIVERFRAVGTALTELPLEVLPPDDAADMARRLLGSGSADLAPDVARQAGGNPLFIGELAHHVRRRTAEGELEQLELGRLLNRRIQGLAEGPRRVLELVALAGPQLNRETLRLAGGLSPGELAQAWRTLSSARLVRGVGESDRQRFEPFHDRVREAVLSCLSESSRRRHHRALAVVSEGIVPPEQLAYHWRGAGEPGRAAAYAEAAAEEALDRFDFDRAAHHYRMALALGAEDSGKRRGWTVALAETLAQAGRPAEAAAAFTEAAASAAPAAAVELRRRAAEELLRGGYPAEGLELMGRVLENFGFRFPATPRRAVIYLLAARARLALRGLGWHERLASDIAPRELVEVDSCWAVAAGLGAIDPLRGAVFQVRHLRLALEAGERMRVVRALAAEVAYQAVHRSPRARQLSARNQRLAAEMDDPQLQGLALISEGFVAYYLDNHWRTALELFGRAREQFKDRAGGWELDTAKLWSVFSQMYLGELAELERRVPEYAAAAEERGDRFMSVNVRARANLVWLIRDDVESALRELELAAESWVSAEEGAHLQHFFILWSSCEIALYRNRPHEADEIMARDLPRLDRAQLTRVRLIKLELLILRVRVALARAAALPEGSRARSLAEVRRLVAGIRRSKLPLGQALEPAFAAAAAHLGGDKTSAMRRLGEACERLEALETMLYAQAVRHRLGGLLDGDEGERLQRAAETWLRSQGVRNPERLMASLIPGL